MGRKLTETFYITLRRDGAQYGRLVGRIARSEPQLAQGECAVKVRLSLPEEAFEPLFNGPDLSFEVGEVIRAVEVAKEK